MAIYKIPYQNLSFDVPDPGSLFRSEGSDRLYQIKDKKVYSYNPADIGGIEGLKSRYGIDWNSLAQRSASQYGDMTYAFPSSSSQGWAPFEGSWDTFAPSVATPGGVTTKTIDPNNPNRAIDIIGDIPASQAAPSNYLQNLLGGQYMNTPAQAQALYPSLTMDMPKSIPSKALISGATLPEPTIGQTISETQQKAGNVAATLIGDQTPYSNFVNVNGTIYNLQGKGYASPTELARDLGIPADKIDWSQIQPGNIPSPPATSQTNYSAQVAQADPYQKFLDEYTKRQESLWGKVKDFLGIGQAQKTPEQIVNEIMPEVPAKVKELDLSLAQLETTYQQTILNSEKRLAPMSFIRGEQALAERQYLINKNSLLMQRDALMGDYDRATERAKMIYTIQKDQRAEQRENQQMAINFMLQTAQGQEAIALQAFSAQIDRQNKLEDRAYQEKQDELNSIKSVAAADPIAFAKYVAANGYPTSSSQLLAVIGKYKPSEKPNIFGSAESGYYEQYYDMPTNTWKTRKVVGGNEHGNEPGIINLFDSIIQSALDSGATSSQAALAAVTYAETNGISLTVAERNTITKRASELKPIPKKETPKMEKEIKPYVPSSPSSYGAGKEYSKIIGGVTEELLEEKGKESQFVYKNILQPIGSFFNGLFGK